MQSRLKRMADAENTTRELTEMLSACLKSGEVMLTVLPYSHAYNVRMPDGRCIWADDLPVGGYETILEALALMAEPSQRSPFSQSFSEEKLQHARATVIADLMLPPFGCWRIDVEKADGSIELRLSRLSCTQREEKEDAGM